LRFYNDIASHSYQGLALSVDEQSQLIAVLGGKKALLLQNHGGIICGSTVQQAFYLMDVLDRACKIQLLAGAVEDFIIPDPEVCRLTYKQLCSDGDQEGQVEWPAYLGLLNKKLRK